jgi:predicted tellurium resistance membrane protein TerC
MVITTSHDVLTAEGLVPATLTFLEVALGVDNVISFPFSGKLPDRQQSACRTDSRRDVRIGLLMSIVWITVH